VSVSLFWLRAPRRQPSTGMKRPGMTPTSYVNDLSRNSFWATQ